jgi:hypothetical protein
MALVTWPITRKAAGLPRPGKRSCALGRNIRIDYRWGVGDADRYRRPAAELVALAPDVILASGTTAAAAVQRVSTGVALTIDCAIRVAIPRKVG